MSAMVDQNAGVTPAEMSRPRASTPIGAAAPQSAADLKVAAQRARSRNTMWVWIGRVAVTVVVLGGWQLFTALEWVDPFFYGQPSEIWNALVTLFTQGTAFGTIWEQLWVTVQEAIFGFLLGTVLGVVIGILLGSNRYLSNVFNPYIKIVNSIPRIVLGSIFIVAFGLGIFPKILLAAVLVFFAVFFNAYQGVREVDQNLISNVRVLGASPLQVARHVTIPSAMTWIIASLHTAFGFSIIGALVAEVLGAQKGIGLIISQAQGRFDPNTVFACMAIMAVVTLGAEYLISLLEGSVLKWRPPVRSEAQSI
jgi:NitT/TauT family transport system permease protein